VLVLTIVVLVLIAALAALGAAFSRTRSELSAALERNLQLEAAQADTVRRLEGEQERREARERDLGERDVQLDDTRRDLDAVKRRADAAELALRDAQARLDSAEAESASAAEALEAARDELAAANEALAASRDEKSDVHDLWALEIARSERRWQLSVSPGMDLPSPFDETTDPLKLAVEVEASALREEVGTQIDVAWDLQVELPDEASLLVLRLAQELLADAAARAETLELRVGPEDDGVAVELRALDEEGAEVPVLLPELSSGRVRPGEGGVWVVSRA
jgi:hypothetical protein